jgi:peroxiredoxin
MIKLGDKLPEATLMTPSSDGPQKKTTAEIFAGKTVALFAVPGAFTPTCSAKHLPSYREHAADFKSKGVDVVACLSVNDAHVMKAWAKDQDAGDMLMLADGSADFVKALGLDADFSKYGMGVRSQRFSMLVKDGVVEKLNVEEAGEYKISSAEYLLGQL